MRFDPSGPAAQGAEGPQAQTGATQAGAGQRPDQPRSPSPPGSGGSPPGSGAPARPPSTPFRPRVDRVNRVVLTLLGLLFLSSGVLVLLAGFDVLGGRTAQRPVLTPQVRAFAARHGWFWPAIGAAVGLVTLAALAWLLAQAGRGKLRGLRVADDGTGGVHLDAVALTDAVENDAAGCPGVHAVHADLLGRRDRPLLRLTAIIDPEADVEALRGCLEGAVLRRARSAVGLPDLAVEVDLAPASRGAPRVR